MTTIYEVLRRPLVTEKSNYQVNKLHQYVFEVAPDAGKIEIKNAVEQIFGVKVAKVNTVNYDGKEKRVGAGRPGTRKSWN